MLHFSIFSVQAAIDFSVVFFVNFENPLVFVCSICSNAGSRFPKVFDQNAVFKLSVIFYEVTKYCFNEIAAFICSVNYQKIYKFVNLLTFLTLCSFRQARYHHPDPRWSGSVPPPEPPCPRSASLQTGTGNIVPRGLSSTSQPISDTTSLHSGGLPEGFFW